MIKYGSIVLQKNTLVNKVNYKDNKENRFSVVLFEFKNNAIKTISIIAITVDATAILLVLIFFVLSSRTFLTKAILSFFSALASKLIFCSSLFFIVELHSSKVLICFKYKLFRVFLP